MTDQQIIERLRQIAKEAVREGATKDAVFANANATCAEMDSATERWHLALHGLYGGMLGILDIDEARR